MDYPKLMKARTRHLVVFFVKEKCGCVVKPSGFFELGYYMETWVMADFSDYQGVVRIQTISTRWPKLMKSADGMIILLRNENGNGTCLERGRQFWIDGVSDLQSGWITSTFKPLKKVLKIKNKEE